MRSTVLVLLLAIALSSSAEGLWDTGHVRRPERHGVGDRRGGERHHPRDAGRDQGQDRRDGEEGPGAVITTGFGVGVADERDSGARS